MLDLSLFFTAIIEIKDDNVSDYQPKVFSAKGSMNFNESKYFVGYLNEINYLIENLFDSETVKIKINPNKKGLKKRNNEEGTGEYALGSREGNPEILDEKRGKQQIW